MTEKRLLTLNRALCAVLVIASLPFVVSCAVRAPTPPPAPPLPTLAREVVFIEVPDPAKAVAMLEVGEIQVHASGLTDPELARKIRASPAMSYATSYGTSWELTFNPVGPTFPKTDKLNPFHVPAIREAVNWLIDRNYIAEEIHGGLAKPRYLPLTSAFPDYVRLADVARTLEIKYSHNPDKARAIITEEMKKLGAVLVDKVWHYAGKPVKLIFLIRTEDERRAIGDYAATLLENLGFVVDRQYKTAAEASPLWIGGDPTEGRWHLYTGGWITTVVSRDQGGNFNFFYTPRGRPEPLWQAYTPSARLAELADTLARGDYKSWEERQALMAEVLDLTMKDSVRIWLVDRISIWPHRAEVAVTADLAGGIAGSWLWPYTLRFVDGRDGKVTMGMPSILTEPWNPVAGSNWIFDQMIMRATAESPLLPDPFTGLLWPQWVKAAEVYIQEGLPVTKSLDWLELKVVPSIKVAEDAWIDWDAVAQRFITVGEAYPQGLSARTKSVIHYVDDLYKRRWHDGTQLSLEDLVLGLILTFDLAKKQSPIFDEAQVPAFETFIRYFRGARILQKDPLVVEVYSDQIFPDAEWMVRAGYFYAAVPWHKLALGILAETDRKLAFSSSKADRLKIEWMSYIAGPSLAVLERYRLQALKEGFIPYENTLGAYVTREEVRKRYEAIGEWYQRKKHFWVGQGPFYVESIHPVQKIVVIRRFEKHLKPEERWLAFTEPRIAAIEVSGPARVKAGAQAEFIVKVTFKGKPYPVKDIDFVKFLLFDAVGELMVTEKAEAVWDGLWRIVLTPEQIRHLKVGSNRLEVIVAPRVVSIPSFELFTFVTHE